MLQDDLIEVRVIVTMDWVKRGRYINFVSFLNSKSVINKIDTLRGIACVEELNFIGITETWLDIIGKHFLPEVGIDGYTFVHRDRVGRRGGGVALYVRNTLNCCQYHNKNR